MQNDEPRLKILVLTDSAANPRSFPPSMVVQVEETYPYLLRRAFPSAVFYQLSFGNIVYVSGKGPGTAFKGDITAQTKNVLDQIEESLKIAGSSMDKVLKVNVYLTDMKNFEGMNAAYIGRFGADPPVRTTVSVSDIPDHSLVEIDCIAHL